MKPIEIHFGKTKGHSKAMLNCQKSVLWSLKGICPSIFFINKILIWINPWPQGSLQRSFRHMAHPVCLIFLSNFPCPKFIPRPASIPESIVNGLDKHRSEFDTWFKLSFAHFLDGLINSWKPTVFIACIFLWWSCTLLLCTRPKITL